MDAKDKKKKDDISLGNILGGKIDFNLDDLYIDEILNEEVKPFGRDGGHITIKGKHVGKKARVIIYKKWEDNKKE